MNCGSLSACHNSNFDFRQGIASMYCTEPASCNGAQINTYNETKITVLCESEDSCTDLLISCYNESSFSLFCTNNNYQESCDGAHCICYKNPHTDCETVGGLLCD